MRISFLKKAWRNAAGAAVLLGGMSFFSGSAIAQDAATCGVQPASDACKACDKIFADAGAKLTEDLCRLTKECCNPGCTDDSCNGDACNGGSDCCLGDPVELFGETEGTFRLGGWTQFGYHTASTGLFNTHPDNINLHQQWLFMEKEADGSCGLDWGFRADVMYGVDGPNTASFGNNPGNWDLGANFNHGIYSWAIPQLYLEFASGDWSVKAGHFYTIVGYETVTSPDNFFYSHAYTMNNTEPFTHTGLLATYQANDSTEVYAGWTAGWDTGFDRFGGGSNFIGGAKVAASDSTNVTYITTIGDFGARGSGYSHSFVMDTAVSDNLTYVLQSDFLNSNVGGGGGAGRAGFGGGHQYGLNQYLIYAVNDCLGVGARMEWWKNSGDSWYAATFGVNYRPHANVVIRPEVREDWSPTNSFDQTSLGVDVILTF